MFRYCSSCHLSVIRAAASRSSGRGGTKRAQLSHHRVAVMHLTTSVPNSVDRLPSLNFACSRKRRAADLGRTDVSSAVASACADRCS
eukprot:3820388-Prymnesium_polylepis.1